MRGDVTCLPYEDNSMSGYISLGVVEHFIEGPQKAIAEAYRVLRPGGIAIITTPNISFYVRYRKLKTRIKKAIKKLIGRRIIDRPFFQYEYTPEQLKHFCQAQGFYVSRAEGCDLLFPFNQIGGLNGANLVPGSFAYWFSNKFENTWIKNFGGQSITVSIKSAPLMHCFLNGKLSATPDSLQRFDVPISKEMQNTPMAKNYIKNKNVSYACRYLINPKILNPEPRICEFTGKQYVTDPIFETFGFNSNVCSDALLNPEINILLCAENIQPIWRKRNS